MLSFVPELQIRNSTKSLPAQPAAVLIMAAGTGARLWPLSHVRKPKQFVDLLTPGESMLQTTYKRAAQLTWPQRIFVTVSASMREHAATQCPSLPRENIITLPQGYETLPGVAYAMAWIDARYAAAPVVLLASDNVVGDELAFVKACEEMVRAASDAASLVSLGIAPTYPSDAYGYMHRGEAAPFGPHSAYGLGYVEKPSRAGAAEFLRGGKHDWNSGMFAWRTRTFFDAFTRVWPDKMVALTTLRTALANQDIPGADAAMHALPNISLDHGLMEKISAPRDADDPGHVFVTGKFAWDDVGSFVSLSAYLPSDSAKNRTRGNVVARRASKNILIAQGTKRIDIDGVSNLIVVAGEQGDVLVCARSDMGRLKELASLPLSLDCGDEDDNSSDAPSILLDSVCNRIRGGAGRTVALVGVRHLDVTVSGDDISVRARESRLAQAERLSAPVKRPATKMPVALWSAPAATAAAMAQQLVDDLSEALAVRLYVNVVFSAGNTPREVYRLLTTTYRDALAWHRIRFFQMDEYRGLAPDDERRFSTMLRQQLVEPLGMQGIYLTGEETDAQMRARARMIARLGGLDVVLHGIGSNGHLGFNEPGAAHDSTSGVVPLAQSTRSDLARASRNGAPPTHGVTLGLDILNAARRVRVMALGEGKRQALVRGVCGPRSVESPFSSLQEHADVRVIADRAAWRNS